MIESFIGEGNERNILFQNEGVLFIRGAKPKKQVTLKQSTFQSAIKMFALPTSSSFVSIPSGLASIYRLSGDTNPLHIDPQIAIAAGFPKPILHGMCSFGICAKELVKAYCNNCPQRMHQIQARFSKPVLPGQALRIEASKVGAGGLVAFQAFSQSAKGKEELVISNGVFQFDSLPRL